MTAYLNALGLNCALGLNTTAVAQGLFAGDRSGLRRQGGWLPGADVLVAPVPGELAPLPVALACHDSRNNRLLLQAAGQIEAELRGAVARYGAHRVAVVLGTSTSGIGEATAGFQAYLRDGHLADGYNYSQQLLEAPAECLAQWLGSSGPGYVISTACTSSGRALMSARRLLDLGACDAVVCGGVDSLCALTLNGFSALAAVSAMPCNPFSGNRDGINIGEGAALFLMTREPGPTGKAIALLGAGASSDAHHISAPDPTGGGALAAMRQALAQAGLGAEQIGYLNLHGTATVHNDAMESLAVAALFPAGVPCSSSKSMTGHTLGAAAALEAAFCWLSLQHGRLPPHLWDGQPDPQLPALNFTGPGARLAPGTCLMSNAFAFGGNNVSLILGELHA
ncbi:beta-ketoacyl-[acyl-carrier-protein] synthase family protein [Pseudomonas sp. RIT-PI-S]|uniref:beta-ketoacyl-[acyl-carrier-protein] synthase family protein n=1 Tax=Pseudomonas sp. RIT-PI-S TaxID=3035295 RepID=UPI0021DAECCB|nr:beta-ketoacyl-[acyl-carrier-protein] synthase family protein [Pseudomonas sp. RIT-PI-S]